MNNKYQNNQISDYSSLEIKKLEEYINTCNKYIEEIKNKTIKIEEFVKRNNLNPEQRTNIFLNAFKNKTPEEWIKLYQALKSKAEYKLEIIIEQERKKKTNTKRKEKTNTEKETKRKKEEKEKNNKKINRERNKERNKERNTIINLKNKISNLSSKEGVIVSSILIITFLLMFSISLTSNNNKINKNNFIDNAVTANAIGRIGSTSISSYDTNIKLIEEVITPVYREATYKILNEKDLDVAWIITTPGTTLRATIKDSKGESTVTKTKIIGSTNNFIKDWNEENGIFKDIKSQLKKANSPTNLEKILPIDKLEKEPLVIHEYKHPKNTWAYIESWSPPKSGKILFLDPAISWWNSSWKYAQEINVTNNQNKNFTNERVKIILDNNNVGNNFDWNNNNSLRFTYVNKTNSTNITETNIPYYIESWDKTNNKSTIWVLVTYIPSNKTAIGGANGESFIKMYYDNPTALSESNYTALFGQETEIASYNSTLGAPSCNSLTRECKATSNDLQCSGQQRSPGPENNEPNTIDNCADGTSTSSTTCHSDESTENISIKNLNGTAFKVGDTIQANITYWCYRGDDDVAIFYSNNISSPSWSSSLASTTCPSDGYHSYVVNITLSDPGTDSSSFYQAVRGVIDWRTAATSCPANRYNDIDDLSFLVLKTNDFSTSFNNELNNAYVITNLTNPINGTTKHKSENFLINGTVLCSIGDCGNTSASLEFLSVISPIYTWTETDDNDFNSYNKSENISIKNNEIRLRANTPYHDWWNDDYYYRFFFNTSNILSNYSNYYLLLKLNSTNTGNNFVWNNNNSLRIYNPSQGLLDFDIINWNSSTKNASIIVNIPKLISSQNYLLYFYYNNSQASKTEQQYWIYSETATYDSSWLTPSCNYFTKTCSAPSNLLECNINQDVNELNGPNTIDACLPSGATGTCHSDESVENISITSLNDSVIKKGDTIQINITVYCYNTQDRVGIFYTNDTSDTANVPWQQLTASSLSCSGNRQYETFTINKKLEDVSDVQAVRGVIKYNSDITSACPASSYTDADDLVFKVLSNDNFTTTNSSEEKHEYLSTGEYISNAFDTSSADAKFKNIYWSSNTNSNTSIKVFTRSSSDNNSWSAWFQEINNTNIDASDNRYLQYKIQLSTTNTNQSPILNDINSKYEIKTIGWNAVSSSSSLSTTNNNPYACGNLNETNKECYPSWTITPKQVGNYNLKIRTNSSENPSSFDYNNISLIIKEKTYILSYSVSPSTAVANDTLELKALLVDSSSQAIIGANITFYDVTNNTFLGSNLTDSDGYATIYYKIPESFILGTHNLNASYKGNSTLYYEQSNTAQAQLIISSTPNLKEQTASPKIAGTGETIRLSINASDGVGIDKVWVNVTKPDNSHNVYFMTNDLGQGKNGTYYYDFSDTWLTGTYVFKISANNSDGILVDPPGNFSINITGAMYIDPEKTKYKNYETVNLNSRRQSNWWNSSWLYRSKIKIEGSNSSLSEYQVPVYLDTQSLINQGKLNGDCSDLRFVSSKNIYELPVTITNNLGKDLINYSTKISIVDNTIVSHMSSSGNDIRIFNHSTTTPYSDSDYLNFWINSISSGRAEFWIKIPNLNNGDSKTIYVYYGDNNVVSVANYSKVFTTPIGLISKTSSNGSFNNTLFNDTINNTSGENIFNDSNLVVVASLMTDNDVSEAAARVINVTKNNFSVKAEESATLDGVHSVEEVGFLALKKGSWLIGGQQVIVNTTYINNPSGNTYSSISFSNSFSATPNIFTQIQTYNNTAPTHTRQDNPSNAGFDVKLENGDSSDIAKNYETVGYIALPGGTIQISNDKVLTVGNLVTTNSQTTIPYGSSFTNPSIIAKIQTENGGDNSHERIDSTIPSTWVEEEEAADGSHTTETISWLAGDKGIIYGTSLDSQPSTSVGSEKFLDSKDVLLDYYLEGGCNSTNTSLLVQIPTITANSNSTIFVYYDNPSASSMSSLEDVMTYDSPQTIGYVVNGLMASNSLIVYSLSDNNSMNVGGSSTSLNEHQSSSFSSLNIGTEVKASKLVEVESSADNSGSINPSSWANTEFVFFNYRDSDIFDILSPWGTANVTIYDGSSVVWNGNVSNPGITVNQDISNTAVTRIVSDIPILVQHRTSSKGDAYALFHPVQGPVYGVPSSILLIGAGVNGATININSSGATQTQITLGSNGTQHYSGLGTDGNAPAYRLETISSSEIIGVLQQADSDGREANAFLPYEQHGTLFGSSLAVETIAVAASVEGTNCTVYDSNDNIISSKLSSGNALISHIGFGSGNDNLFVSGGWIMKCDHPVWAYYDRDSGGDENNLFSYPQMKQYYYPEPTSSFINGSEESVFTGLQNLGSTNITGYLYLAVETNLTGNWQVISPPVYQDINPRVIEPGTILNISNIWKLSGSWSTSTRAPGNYRVYAALRDPDNNVIVDSKGVPLEAKSDFEIIEAVLKLNNLTHENINEHSINEYEVGDKIDWINITIQAINNTAISAVIDLNLINASGDYPGWGPNSQQSCGDIAENTYCTKQWNNNSNGYLIPLSVGSGSYDFYWNVSINSSNGIKEENNSISVKIHNIPSTFSSKTSSTRVYINDDAIQYYFNFSNLWSKNLTNAKVKINCPEIANLSCVCIGTQGSSPEICDLGNVENNSVNVVAFNISANSTSLQGDFYVNVTLNYSNPGLENKSWQEYNSELVEVRKQGIIAITITDYPSFIIRNSGILNNITMYINNTAFTTSNNVYSNYTFPDSGIGSPGYFNQTPLNQLVSSLAPNETAWHNLSFYTNLSTSLGDKVFKINSGSEAGQIDFKDLIITINAKTNITNISVSDLNVSKGESTTIFARLVYDNGSAIVGKTINFYDLTDSYSIGSAVTNASGYAVKIYTIPQNASSGLHSINVSFAGYSSDYILESNSQTNLDVGEKPVIHSDWTSPSIQSSGSNSTIYANVSDDDVLTNINIDIYYPNGSLAVNNGLMTFNSSNQLYYYIFNDTWKNGTYNYNITAFDNTGSQTKSNSDFLIKNFGFIYFELNKNTYSQNENVLLKSFSNNWWWNRAWLKKKEINITLENNHIYDNNNNGVLGENDDFISNFQYNIILNTSKMILDGDLYSNCSDLRFIYKDDNANLNANSDNAIYNLEYYFETPCNSEETSIWLNIPYVYGNNSVNKLEMYYAHNNNSFQDSQYNSISANNISKENIFGGVAYVVSNELATSDLEIAAYYNDTNVCVNNGTQNVYCTTIDAYQTATIGAGNLTPQSKIIADKAISAGFTYTGVGDTITPLSWLGDKFVFPAPRGSTQSIDFVSPYADANVSLYNNAGLVSSTTVSRGGHGEINYNAATNAGLRIVANTSILVHYEDAVGNNDFIPLYKETNELYGIISSGGNLNDIACAYNNTNVTAYYSNGTTSYFTCNSYDTIDLGKGSSAGAGPSVYVVANNSIGGFGAADGDGTEAVVYLPPEELDNKYVIPQASQYISIVAIEPNTYCGLYDQSGVLQTSITSTSYSKPRPQDVIRFTGSPIPAGYFVECNSSVYAYYEYDDQNGETNLLNIKNWRNYDSSNTTIGNEENYSSILSNTGNNTLNGYLRMVVQRNISNSWVNISTQINDISSSNKREIPFISALDLESIWNTNVWNTGNSEAGNYRLLVELLDPFNNTISNDDKLNANNTNINANNEFIFYSLFKISEPILKLNLTNIKIYDVTDTLNKHIYTGNLSDQGLNKTFILESDKIYRVEFYIYNEDNSTSWIINKSDINHFNLNKDWTIDEKNDIWYYNETSGEFLGGEFINSSFSSQANVSWNSSLGGSAINGSTIVFSYVLNLSNASSEKRQVHFYLNNSLLTLNDYSIFNILSSDKEPPVLFNNTYNISSNDILRGESTIVYARWNESISAAKVSYNSTNPIVNDYNISLSDPNPNNWTNYTINTTSLWTLGTHVSKIKASDLLNNWNNTLSYIYFNVSGLARITSASLNVSSIIIGDSIKYTCRVLDNTNGEAINNYIVKFYNSTSLLGINQTNASGYASFIYTDNSAGVENITCNISANKSRFYKIDNNNEISTELITRELEAPKYSSVSSNTSVVHKGESILLSTYWTDNFLLDTAVLSLNTSNNGDWFNSSTIDIGSGGTANNNWANFSYLIDNNLKPSNYAWKQFGNDSSNNINITPIQNFEVWGWAKLESINLNPASMYITNTTKITCRVIDKNNNSGINNYNVSFYNSTSLLGINQTNASGYANYFYTDNSSGLEEITCTITHNANLKYNITSTQSEYNKSTNLNTGIGGDITPPGILNNNYGINDTSLKKGESILIYGQWNESINSSKVAYNSTTNSINEYSINPPYTGNWTNASVLIANDWLVGEHAIRLIATDQSNNTNNSAEYFYFNVTATSRVTWISPEGDLNENQITLRCYVDEEESGNPISDYIVYFYNSTGDLLGTNTTNNNGYANLTIDSTNYLDSQEFSCRIFSSPSDYYYIGNNFLDSSTLFFDRENPAVELIEPNNGFITTNIFVTLKYRATDNHASNLTCDVFDNGNLIYNNVNSPNNEIVEKTKSFSSGDHFWNVTCLDSVNNYNFSDTWKFTIQVVDNEAPNITLISPDDNAYLNNENITLTYNVTDANNITNCVLYINDVYNQTDNSVSQGENSFKLYNLSEDNYYWNVMCEDENSNKGNSTQRRFTIDLGGPSAFNLLSPINNTISDNNSPTLTWEASSDNNFWNYTILVSLNSNFLDGATTKYTIFNASQTSITVLPLFMNEEYFWKVIAYDASGKKTDSNQVFRYITDDKKPEVVLINPPDKDNDPDGNVTFTFRVYDNKINNCSLYTNESGSWKINQTNYSINTSSINSFILKNISLNKTIIWNIECYDSLNHSSFAVQNRTLFIGQYNKTQGNLTIPVNATANNTLPFTNNILVQSEVFLVAGDSQNVSCKANISDYNGVDDIIGAQGVLYHSTSFSEDLDNNSKHYTTSNCIVTNIINSTTKEFECKFGVEYYALPGIWNCELKGIDSVGTGTSSNSSTTIHTLSALDTYPHIINFSNLEGGIPSNETNISIINLGNVAINVSSWGYANTPGDNLAMSCDIGNIPISDQKFSLIQGTLYESMTSLSGDPLNPNKLNTNLEPRIGNQNSSTSLYWRVASFGNNQGICNGNVVLQAETS